MRYNDLRKDPVHTGAYRCVPVHTSTSGSGMHRYILVNTGAHQCRAQRTLTLATLYIWAYDYDDHLIIDRRPMVPVHTGTYRYIPVHTGAYRYIPVHTGTYQYIPVYTGMWIPEVHRGMSGVVMHIQHPPLLYFFSRYVSVRLSVCPSQIFRSRLPEIRFSCGLSCSCGKTSLG